MRPRVFPAEDAVQGGGAGDATVCFNEAAGIPRGRHHCLAPPALPTHRFNEAAGIPRGRPAAAWSPTSRTSSFNEAAGIPRGRQSLASRLHPGRIPDFPEQCSV